MPKYSDDLEALNSGYQKIVKIESDLWDVLCDIGFNPIIRNRIELVGDDITESIAVFRAKLLKILTELKRNGIESYLKDKA
jgi:hypothetical protein